MKSNNHIKSGKIRRVARILFMLFTLQLSLFTNTSCVDTDLLPYESTVGEDFWKTKDDVSLMVNAAYVNLATDDLIQRLIVWGSFRSDELILNSDVTTVNSTQTSLAEIETGNINTTNIYGNWASLYRVINYCNMVIERGAGVVGTDPDYTSSDYALDVAQMKTIRALCYFYLVRVFRDVPYITEAYMQNSQNMNVSQTAPSVILQGCINDLIESIDNIYDPQNFTLNSWKSRGLVNKHTVYALLADIYLWRASVTMGTNPEQANADYQECIKYSDIIINEKNASHSNYLMPGEVVDPTNPYPALAEYAVYFSKIFVKQNSEESIFEIQFNTSTQNTGLRTMYYQFSGKTAYMVFPATFGKKAASSDAGVFVQGNDARIYTSRFVDVNNEGNYYIRKCVTEDASSLPNDITSTNYKIASRSQFDQNFIVYRMTDVMLMKAEALTQLAALTSNTEYLTEAFNLVKGVNDRVIYDVNGTNSSQALKPTDYTTVTDMEKLVLAERLRELCFEGKRWFDLLRFNYRRNAQLGINTNYDVILADLGTYIPNSQDMLLLMSRSNPSPSALISKMPTEPYLYMPIYEDEMKVNPSLKQNPVYSSSKQYQRN